MTDDDDFLTMPVPEPDAEPTAAERAHAKAFAELVDKTIASGRMPPAMSADDRALLEVATVIRATSGSMELAASKQRTVVEDALRQAIGAAPQASLSSAPPVIPFRRRMVPWAIATASSLVAAAAIAMLVLRKPVVIQTTAATAMTPTEWRSRPADPLIGKIENECIKKTAAECAREATLSTNSRIDHIFADRLDGYRERLLARPGGKP